MNTREKEPLAWSDELAPLIELLREYKDLYPLREILQINLIVDANIILADLRWLVLKRRDSSARTYLLEVLDANTLTVYAPSFLENEIEAKLPDMARKDNIDLSNLAIQWKKYRKYIKFVNVGGPDNTYDDPYDAPYMKLQAKLNIPILSEDRDIGRMGGSVIQATVLARLRSYSRAAAIEYSLGVAGHTAILISASLIKAVIVFFNSLIRGSRRPPNWIIVIALAGIGALLLFPDLRKGLKNFINSLSARSKELGQEVLAQIELLVIEHNKAQDEADKERKAIEEELPKRGKSTLR